MKSIQVNNKSYTYLCSPKTLLIMNINSSSYDLLLSGEYIFVSLDMAHLFIMTAEEFSKAYPSESSSK